MMHVVLAAFFPAVYACDAFVDMSSYGWGGAEAQKWVDQATLLWLSTRAAWHLCRASNAQTTCVHYAFPLI